MRPIDALGVAHVQWFQYKVQSIICSRNNYQVNMVGHEAIGEHFNLVFVAVLFEPRQVRSAVLICEKNVFTPITALGNVMWKVSKYCSW